MKYLLGLCFLSFMAWGGEIQWNDSYDQALLKAKKENKPLMVLITTESCRYCRKLEATTLQDEGVIAKMNTHFQTVHVTKDKSIYPKTLKTKMVPTTYFIDPRDNKVLYSIPGFWDAEDYTSILDDATRKYTK